MKILRTNTAWTPFPHQPVNNLSAIEQLFICDIMLFSLTAILIFLLWPSRSAIVYDFEKDFHAIPNDPSPNTLRFNRDKLSTALQAYSSGSTIVIPFNSTFYLMHGVFAREIHDAVLQIDGILKFERETDDSLRNPYNSLDHHRSVHPSACIHIEDSSNIVITSSMRSRGNEDDEDESPSKIGGIIDGGGVTYWGVPYVGYTQLQERRPVLFRARLVSNMTIEYIVFKDAPLYSVQMIQMNRLVIRYSSIIARRTHKEGHSLIDLSAFNTDGIDVSGNDVHVHDVDIWTQDDCIAVKDESKNMLFERIYASGLGLVVGSIGSSRVENITFRDSLIYKSYKGIYMKFREDEGHGLISNILFENILIEEPIQWGLWIGPAQQAISSNVCKANPCSLCWPHIPLAQCYPIKHGTYRNITLRNVIIHNPRGSPGIILADASNPIDTITFENVTVTNKESLSLMLSMFNVRDIRSLFRGMDQPINDHKSWFYRFYLYLFIILCLFVLLTGALLYISYNFLRTHLEACTDGHHNAKNHDPMDYFMKRKLSDDNDVVLDMIMRSKGRYYRKQPIVLCRRVARIFIQAIIFLLICILSFTIHNTLMVFADRSNQSHFFVCDGVVNGVALAETWPVPHCFMDKTKTGRTRTLNFWSEKKNIIRFSELSCVALLLFIFLRYRRQSSLIASDALKQISQYEASETSDKMRERIYTDTSSQVSDSDVEVL